MSVEVQLRTNLDAWVVSKEGIWVLTAICKACSTQLASDSIRNFVRSAKLKRVRARHPVALAALSDAVRRGTARCWFCPMNQGVPAPDLALLSIRDLSWITAAELEQPGGYA
jgi:hypothetical protein